MMMDEVWRDRDKNVSDADSAGFAEESGRKQMETQNLE